MASDKEEELGLSGGSRYMLTTADNPYSPHTEFEKWRVWDERAGYNTLALLARIAEFSFEMSEKDQEVAYDAAVEEIVRFNASGMHKKVLAPQTSR